MNIKAVQEYSHVQCVCVFSIALTTIHLQSQSCWYLHYLRIQNVKYLHLRIQNLKVFLSETSFGWNFKRVVNWLETLSHSVGFNFLMTGTGTELKFVFQVWTGTFKVFICVFNDKYFLMANYFRFQKVVFYWLKPVPRPAVCFVEFFCAAKRPRIEALKLQMCVMVIRPLFAPILMTDLIPVFKRPTESRRYYMETDILDNICVDYFYTFFLNYYNCRFLSRTATLMKWDLKKFWGANFAKVAFHPTLELSTFKYWEIKSGSEEQKLS